MATAAGARLPEVTQNSVHDRGHQLIVLRLALLGSSHCDDLSRPIDVLEAEAADFAASQAVDREQLQNSVVTDLARGPILRALKEPLHIGPCRPPGQAFFSEQPRRIDRLGDSGGTPLSTLSVAEEGAQGVRARRDRHLRPAAAPLDVEEAVYVPLW